MKRIKIVKCSGIYWYSGIVGREFLVGNMSQELYMIYGETGCLLKDDCVGVIGIEPVRYIRSHELWKR